MIQAVMNGAGVQPSREFDEIFSIAYDELRRLAGSVKRGDQSATLNTTALVNEAWIRLRNTPEIASDSPLHFKRIAARAMRQILVEAARRRHAQKRGGEAVAIIVSLEQAGDAAPPEPQAAEEVLALDEALTELEQLDARQAQLVQARFFGGLEVSELMQLFQVSESTVMRDWRMARAWLAHRIGGRRDSERA
jgi:RNA polymerase sigma factor (TIGR02999 family)